MRLSAQRHTFIPGVAVWLSPDLAFGRKCGLQLPGLDNSGQGLIRSRKSELPQAGTRALAIKFR
jgi:hypothetical protein